MKHQFESFRSWRIVGWCRLREFLQGLYGIVYIWLLWGILSIFIYIGKQIEAFCRRETIAAFIISILYFLMGTGWYLTFLHERAMTISAQHKADSLAYDVSRITQMYDSTDIIVINGDTIKH